MPSVSTPLGTTQPYIPAVPALQIGRFAGLHMHFATLEAFQAAFEEELGNIDITSPIWPEGQIITVATECAENGVFRSWSALDGNARRFHLCAGRMYEFIGDYNTLHGVGGTPGIGLGVNGDYAADWNGNMLYLKVDTDWTYVGPINGVSQDLVVTLVNASSTATFNRGLYTDWSVTTRLPGTDASWSNYADEILFRRPGIYAIDIQASAYPDPGDTQDWPDFDGSVQIQTFYGCSVGGAETSHTRTGGLNQPNTDQEVHWTDQFIVEIQPSNLTAVVGMYAKAYSQEFVPVQFGAKVRVTRLGDAPIEV